MRSFLIILLSLISIPLHAYSLDELFNQLQLASTSEEANKIELLIWDQWLIGPTQSDTQELQLAVKSIEQGEYTFALVRLDELIDASPKFAEAWNKRATLHYMMGNFNESLDDIKQTISLEPRHFGAWSGLGMIFEHLGQFEAALKAHEKVIAIYPLSLSSKTKIDFLKKTLQLNSV